MTAACDRCAKSIKRGEEVIICMGFCDHVVHLRCANIDKNIIKAINDSSNLNWMCDECVKLMKLTRFRNVISSVGNTINELTRNQQAAHDELKRELMKHSEQIAQLSNQFNSVTPLHPASINRRASKRRRMENDPQVTKPFLGGTKTTDTISIATVPQPTALFWIYLSRLHPSVKPDAVEKLTKESLQCNSAKAIPLIKQGTDVNSLNFISFKVGIDPEYRTAALDPSSWPSGILFREFENTNERNYWMPEPSTPSILVTSDSEVTPHQAAIDTADC